MLFRKLHFQPRFISSLYFRPNLIAYASFMGDSVTRISSFFRPNVNARRGQTFGKVAINFSGLSFLPTGVHNCADHSNLSRKLGFRTGCRNLDDVEIAKPQMHDAHNVKTPNPE